ncbi:MAG: hypothetical protein ACRD8W_23635 [Nitrososphaeraceae archaeon]
MPPIIILISNSTTLSPREKTLLATRFFKLLSEKNSDAERTGQPLAFSTDSIWGTDNLDGISKESITSLIINHLRKLDYIIVHADRKISINNNGKDHYNEEIIMPENIQ